MQALNEVSDLQENCHFLAMERAHLATSVKRWQRFGCGHPPDSGQHSREALADHHGAQSPVCAGGPSMAHCRQNFTEGSRRLVVFYVITLTELDPPDFGNIKNVTYMFEISHLNW